MGMFTNTERWRQILGAGEVGFRTEDYLSQLYPAILADLTVNARVVPSADIAKEVSSLKQNERLLAEDGTWIAYLGTGNKEVLSSKTAVVLNNRWDLYARNEEVIRNDFGFVTHGRASQKLSTSNTLIGDPEMLFIEAGAIIEAAVINVKGGPVYIGKNAEVMEGSMIRGPFALLENAALKMGAKMYGGSTIGPFCKVGGEVSNSIFYAYSNKGHDGFVGNSLIGEWCNLGADTNTSNLKNNYGTVRTYDYRKESMIETDVTFMGLCMGDHSKSSINTMFNTASVTGVFTSVFSSGFPDKFLPSFSWGDGDTRFEWDKVIEVAEAMMVRRGKQLSKEERSILEYLYQLQ
jgi:UDP-N-acetylglucosamine diphosphorylase/glucosamine-1-phosphate N-acetyltransferase